MNDRASTAQPTIDVQFSLVPASDRFIPIILDAVSEIGNVAGLAVSTDAVSSHLSGSAGIVFGAIAEIFLRAIGSGAHIVLPFHAAVAAGGRADDGPVETVPSDYFRAPENVGVPAATQFALLSGSSEAGTALQAKAVEFLAALGLSVSRKALVTRIDGDAATILAAYSAILAWLGDIGSGGILTGTVVGNIPDAEAFS